MTRARKVAFSMAALLLLLTIIGVVLSAVLLSPLDREVVVHWNLAGEPDRWGPAWTYPVLIAVLGLVLTAIAIGFAFLRMRGPVEVVDPEPIRLAPGEVAGWSRTVMASAAFYWAVGSAIVVTAAVAAVAIWATSGRAWPTVFLPVLLIVLLALTGGWRVSAGPRGLTVRGLFGLPVFRVRTADIAGVVAVGIQPMRDFGGWGIRGALGRDGHWRTGLIVRAGDAIQVTRRGGKRLVVTVDDAATAAAVLKAYLTP
ncbi:MAG TPA: DUF1648 domain-containing protein [Microbacteriaceae bacterium]|nr:DUF1648 domain-containing protein [Microbacteriaceae bacterium]